MQREDVNEEVEKRLTSWETELFGIFISLPKSAEEK